MREPIISIICNRKCTLFPRVPISIENAILIKDLVPEHFGAIALFNEKSDTELLPSQKCILINPESEIYRLNTPSDIYLSIAFGVNFFRNHGIFNIGNVYRSQHRRKFKILSGDKKDIGELALNNSGDFTINKDTKPDEIESLFKSSISAIKKDKSIEVTLKRFILAISRDDYQSKVIDISICLESLYNLQSEISFRFSLYNSLITAQAAEKRKEIYELMKALYDERSSIVHGTVRQKKMKVEENWDKIIDITRYAILYKLNFLQSDNKDMWDKHLLDLSVGAALRT